MNQLRQSARTLLGCVAASLAVVVAGCNSAESASEASFLEGREMVAIYEKKPPEDFDPDAFVTNLGVVFDIQGARLDRYEGEGDTGVDLGRSFDGVATAGVDLQIYSWGYRSAEWYEDNQCRDCSPATISDADAIARAQELFEATGTLVGDFEWKVYNSDLHDPTAFVIGTRLLQGEPTSDTWVMKFFDGDRIFTAGGYVARPTPIAEVALLTPAEALAQESERLANDVPVESLDVQLAYEATFDRDNIRTVFYPVYRFPLNAELELDTTILAIRTQDLPN